MRSLGRRLMKHSSFLCFFELTSSETIVSRLQPTRKPSYRILLQRHI
jgi:hypothetical protein